MDYSKERKKNQANFNVRLAADLKPVGSKEGLAFQDPMPWGKATRQSGEPKFLRGRKRSPNPRWRQTRRRALFRILWACPLARRQGLGARPPRKLKPARRGVQRRLLESAAPKDSGCSPTRQCRILRARRRAHALGQAGRCVESLLFRWRSQGVGRRVKQASILRGQAAPAGRSARIQGWLWWP